MIMSDNYRILAKLATTLHIGHGDEPAERKRAIGLITDGLYQCKAVHSGLVSKSAEHLTVSKLTKEHFYSRARCAVKIFQMLDDGTSENQLVDFIIEACSIHYVTKRENIDLIPFQKNIKDYPTWQEQYAAAGIELVPYVKKSAKKNVYIIHGIEYNSLSDGAKANNCKTTDVYYRCITSKSKKYYDWKVRKLDNEIQ
jgi:hypothetical protein